jgi:hypothetical protein
LREVNAAARWPGVSRGALALALLALVGAASGSPVGSSAAGARSPLGVAPALVQVVSAVFGVGLVCAALAGWIATPRLAPRPRTASRADLEGVHRHVLAASGTLIAGVAAVAALLGAAALLLHGRLVDRPPPVAVPAPPTAQHVRPAPPAGHAGPLDLALFPIAGGATLVLLTPFAALYRRRRRASRRTVAPDGERGGADPLPEPIEAIEREPDPRRCVLRAYRRMEAALQGDGFERAPGETAAELVQRALGRLGARGAQAMALTAAFERARYSRHGVDERLRRESLRSLRVVVDAIEGRWR